MKNNEYDLQVFLSSTFDEAMMQETREAFRNEINARLNNIVGLMRGNAFLYDLQLGIPEGTSALKTLEICFDKIKESNCFVFILSEKYGKQNTRVFLLGERADVPPEVAQSAYAETIQQGIDDELYIIELEIMEAEKNPALADSRFFFFDNKLAEDQSYAAKIKDAIVEKYQDSDKVMAFDTPEDIKEKLIAYFTGSLSKQTAKLPEDEQNRNLFYAGMLRYYVENEAGIELLEDYRKNNSRRPFVLYGESGSGKSTLLADWLNQASKNQRFISYYVGIKGNSLQEMLTELYQLHWPDCPAELQQADEQKLAEKFYAFLFDCGREGETVLVLDGLNQLLTEQEGSDKYAWIPKQLPENVKLVVSTTDHLASRGFEVQEVPQMDIMAILRHILRKEGKELETATIETALASTTLANTKLPVLARILYNEISETFQYDTIQTELLVHLKNIADIATLTQHYIERLQKRFGDAAVKEALSLLLLSKDGLRLEDLRQMLPESRLDDLFYMLYHEFSHDSQGRMKFGHSYFSKTVEKMFAQDSAFVRNCRFNIVNWFEARFKDEQDLDLIPEIAYQLFELKDQRGMLALLKNIENARYLYTADRYLLVQYTSFLDNREALVDAWPFVENKAAIDFVLNFLADISGYQKLAEWCKSKLSQTTNSEILAQLYKGLTRANMALWNYEAAIEWGEKAASTSEQAADLVEINNYLAEAYYRLGTYDKALNCCQQVIQASEASAAQPIYNHTVVDTHLLMAEIYSTPDNPGYNPQQALETVKQELAHCIEVQGEMHPDTAYCYDCLGKYTNISDAEAIQSFEAGIQICETTLGAEHALTADLYDNLAIKYARMEQHQEALVWHEKALAARKKVFGSQHELVGTTLINIGATLTYLSRFQESLKYFEPARKIYEKLFGADNPRMIDLYRNIAIAWGNFDDFQRCAEWNLKAVDLLKKKIAEAAKPSSDDLFSLKNSYHDIAYSYHQIAELCKNLNQMNEALSYQKKFREYAKLERGVKLGGPQTTGQAQGSGSAGVGGKMLVIILSMLITIAAPIYLWNRIIVNGGAWYQILFAVLLTLYCGNYLLNVFRKRG